MARRRRSSLLFPTVSRMQRVLSFPGREPWRRSRNQRLLLRHRSAAESDSTEGGSGKGASKVSNAWANRRATEISRAICDALCSIGCGSSS
eukprot:3638322-Pyramimonas_sp.AAC.1